MIRTYSKARDGNTKLSNSFRVREFACKDGSDAVCIDTELVKLLQRIRNWAGNTVKITSGYRTYYWNSKIGGAANSYHTKGRAADIIVTSKTINEVAAFAEAIGAGGVERNEDTFYVHVDTRDVRYLFRHKNYRNIGVSTLGGRCLYNEPTKSVKLGSTGEGVKWLQFWLGLWGYKVTIDGTFGAKTDTAVRDVQKRRGLKVDGIAGEKTRNALKGY